MDVHRPPLNPPRRTRRTCSVDMDSESDQTHYAISVLMPAKLTPEMIEAIKTHELTREEDRDRWYAQLGWLICAWDVMRDTLIASGVGKIAVGDQEIGVSELATEITSQRLREKIAIETLELIASGKRNTQDKMTAKGAIVFIESLDRQAKARMCDAATAKATGNAAHRGEEE